MLTKAHLPLLLFAAPAAAQGLPTSHYGDSAGGYFGQVVELIGDVNGDGDRDVAVGAPYSDETFDLGFPVFVENAGSVSVYSGSTGEFLWKRAGSLTSDTEFGRAICDAGDVDGDGIDDLLVGSPAANGFTTNSGKVQLLSGVDGTLMQTYFGSQTDERYGAAICAGHMDPDMTSAEAAIGAPYHDDDDGIGGWAQEGRVEIVELLTGDVLKEFQSGSIFDISSLDYIDEIVRRGWGSQVEYIGDYDDDGYGGIVVSAPFAEYIDASLLGTFHYPNVGFVKAMDPLDPLPPLFTNDDWIVGDISSLLGTTLQAFPIGSPDSIRRWAVGGVDSNVRVYYDFFNEILDVNHGWLDGAKSFALAGQFDGPGPPDYAVGVPGVGSEPGNVYIISGANGWDIQTYEGTVPGSNFGSGVACTDMNGDGVVETWVGARTDDTMHSNGGAVYIESETTCFQLAGWELYGPGTPGSVGVPDFTFYGPPAIGKSTTVQVNSSQTLPAQALMMIGAQPIDVPLLGGTALVNPVIVTPYTQEAPHSMIPMAFPDNTAFCGVTVFLQIIQEDPGAPGGYAFSQGLAITLGS